MVKYIIYGVTFAMFQLKPTLVRSSKLNLANISLKPLQMLIIFTTNQQMMSSPLNQSIYSSLKVYALHSRIPEWVFDALGCQQRLSECYELVLLRFIERTLAACTLMIDAVILAGCAHEIRIDCQLGEVW